MNKIFFTPGPSQLYPTVKSHIQTALANNIGSISHRSKQFEEIFSSTVISLKKLLNIPENYKIFFLSSGTEAMERIIENCVEKESLHFVNGSFSKRFFEIAQELKKEPKKIEAELGKGFDFTNVETCHGMSLHCFTHNETSTGVMLPLEHIYNLKKIYPNNLFALDIVSSAPYADVNYEFFDCVFFSVQKLFGLPAGLGVIILSPEALEKAEYLQKLSPVILSGNEESPAFQTKDPSALPQDDITERTLNIGSYHNFPTLLKYAQKNQTPETPPVLHMYLLHKVVEDMLATGIEKIRNQTEEKAKLLYDFLDTHPTWNAFVKEKEFRSPTVIVAHIGEDAQKVKKYLEEKGMIVGSGYGKNKEVQIRIANFPAVNMEEIKRLIDYLKEYR